MTGSAVKCFSMSEVERFYLINDHILTVCPHTRAITRPCPEIAQSHPGTAQNRSGTGQGRRAEPTDQKHAKDDLWSRVFLVWRLPLPAALRA